jgi:hypothetical protein
VSLRKSPTRTPALLAANRRNAQKSTGPRTARGKAWSRLNRLKHGGDSPEYQFFLNALLYADPCEVGVTAAALLNSQTVVHPLYREWAELCVETEIAICQDLRMERLARERAKKKILTGSKPEGY